MKAGALASGRPFILHRVLPDALFVWWQQQTSVRHIDTITKTAWDAARARHGRFNYSNATAVLRAEYTFAITLHAIGGLSSLERMHEVLIALGMLAEDYHRCAQRDATVGLAICPAIRMFVKRALPLILTCTSWLGAGITGA
jgi:hypothetical protein